MILLLAIYAMVSLVSIPVITHAVLDTKEADLPMALLFGVLMAPAWPGLLLVFFISSARDYRIARRADV